MSWLIVISFAIAIVGGLVLAYTRFGRYTYAIGSNPEAGRRAGIAVDRHLIKVYALAGALSGVRPGSCRWRSSTAPRSPGTPPTTSR